jgi:hypothetical protein
MEDTARALRPGSKLPTFQIPPLDHLSQMHKYPAYAPSSTTQPTPAVISSVLALSRAPSHEPISILDMLNSEGPGHKITSNSSHRRTGTPAHTDAPRPMCTICQKPVKFPSELKMHDLRHWKPFACNVPGCERGFSTTNGLERHTKIKHPSPPFWEMSEKFRCLVPGCKSKNKVWPRLDNFRSHLKRVHQTQLGTEEGIDDMIRR